MRHVSTDASRPFASRPPARSGGVAGRSASAQKLLSRRRAAAMSLGEILSGMSYLWTKSMTAETRARYEEAAAEFLAFAREKKLPTATPSEADEALEKFFDAQFMAGEGANSGSWTVCGIC